MNIKKKKKKRKRKGKGNNTFKEKSFLFKKTLFPKLSTSKISKLDYYLEKEQEQSTYNNKEISLAINNSNIKKALSLNNIFFLIIKEAYKALLDLFNKVYNLLLNNSY